MAKPKNGSHKWSKEQREKFERTLLAKKYQGLAPVAATSTKNPTGTVKWSHGMVKTDEPKALTFTLGKSMELDTAGLKERRLSELIAAAETLGGHIEIHVRPNNGHT